MMIKETITPKEAGTRLGWTQLKVQDHIRDGTLWFCLAAQRADGRWAYIIPKEAFDRFMRGELQKPQTYLDGLRILERMFEKGGVA